mgnify:CR=1 FL=1
MAKGRFGRCHAQLQNTQGFGAKFVARVSPVAWLRLSESIDLHRVDPAAVSVPTLHRRLRAEIEALLAG